jgi:hypothetical protein
MFQNISNIFGTVFSILGGIASIIALVIGLITLFFGRRLFWIFAALIGLSVGVIIGAQFFQGQTAIVRFLIAAIMAVVFAVLAIYTEKMMILMAGFFGLGLLGYFIASLFNLPGLIHWIFFVGLGILGAILISKYMEWALVIISSLLGAVMAGVGLGGLTHFNFLIDLLIFIGLLAGGFFFQSRELKK